jgi:uncharacterized membrane protein
VEHASDSEFIDWVLEGIEYLAVAIEVLAVIIIVLGVLVATWAYLTHRRGADNEVLTRAYRVRMGNTLLVGLEILVAADIVRTVALEPTLESVAVLGLLVVVRTFLSWSLSVEIEGRWPWHATRDTARRAGAGEAGGSE